MPSSKPNPSRGSTRAAVKSPSASQSLVPSPGQAEREKAVLRRTRERLASEPTVSDKTARSALFGGRLRRPS